MISKNLYKNEVLLEACKILEAEINPDHVLPDASPEYRRSLAVSLFYKFVLGTAPETSVGASVKSGGTVLKRGLSSSKREFDTIKKNYPMNHNVKKVEADIQVTGEAIYTNDLPKQVDELFAAFVLTTQANGKILEIDSTNALVCFNKNFFEIFKIKKKISCRKLKE